jgi:hypothetical protein
MDSEEDQVRSEACNSDNAAADGSSATNKDTQSTSDPEEKHEIIQDNPQLHKWVYQTSQEDLTLAENLEKSKWEGQDCGTADREE